MIINGIGHKLCCSMQNPTVTPNTTACDVQRKRYASSATHMVSGSKEVVSWLNSGVYMGTIDAVIHMLRSANALYSSGQNWWGGRPTCLS